MFSKLLKYTVGSTTYVPNFYTLSTSVDTASGEGNFSGVQPGDVVLLQPGVRGRLRIEDMHGTPGMPITFINDGGVVDIQSGNSYGGIDIRNSSNLRVTGSGGTGRTVGAQYTEAQQNAGIKITANRSASTRGIAVKFYDKLAPSGGGFIDLNIEVDHIDLSAYLGVHYSDGSLDRTFIARNFYVHHLYVHDIGNEDPNNLGGEAFYLGETNYNTRFAGIHHNVRVSYCRVARSVRDGVQLSSTPQGGSIDNNIIYDQGYGFEASHSSGIAVQEGTIADTYNNLVYRSARDNIRIRGNAGCRTYNNICVDAGQDPASDGRGIVTQDGSNGFDTPPGPYYVWNNVCVRSRMNGIRAGTTVPGSSIYVQNNICTNNGSTDFSKSSSAVWTKSNNLSGDGSGEVANSNPLFVSSGNVDPEVNNYRLQNGSPAINAGISLGGQFDFDKDNNPRPQGAGWDIGAYERA